MKIEFQKIFLKQNFHQKKCKIQIKLLSLGK